jgi:hypothetical protein
MVMIWALRFRLLRVPVGLFGLLLADCSLRVPLMVMFEGLKLRRVDVLV